MKDLIKEISEVITDGVSFNIIGECSGFDPVDTAFALEIFINENISHFTPVKHWSDCALHNEPAMRKGFCNCMKNHQSYPAGEFCG